MTSPVKLPFPDEVDPDEAPHGYYAVPKSDVPHDKGNLCQFCDWRPVCQRDDTDFHDHNHRCMPHVVVSATTGELLTRFDGVSVVFKKR